MSTTFKSSNETAAVLISVEIGNRNLVEHADDALPERVRHADLVPNPSTTPRPWREQGKKLIAFRNLLSDALLEVVAGSDVSAI